MAKERITWEQLSNLTPGNGAVQSLRDLLIMTNFVDEELGRFFTLRQNVHNGDKLGWVGEMDDIGWAGSGCNPEYKKANINLRRRSGKSVIGRFLWSGVMKSYRIQSLNTA